MWRVQNVFFLNIILDLFEIEQKINKNQSLLECITFIKHKFTKAVRNVHKINCVFSRRIKLNEFFHDTFRTWSMI